MGVYNIILYNLGFVNKKNSHLQEPFLLFLYIINSHQSSLIGYQQKLPERIGF